MQILAKELMFYTFSSVAVIYNMEIVATFKKSTRIKIEALNIFNLNSFLLFVFILGKENLPPTTNYFSLKVGKLCLWKAW